MGGVSVPVAVVASRTAAELIVGLLRSNGVQAAVSADDAGGQEPQLQLQGVRVLVAPADEAEARRVLAAVDGTAEPWVRHRDQGNGRLHQLVREHGGARERTLEITFLEPGAEAYVFTFG